MSDSARFSRNLAVAGLVAGPLLLALSSFLDPAWSDDSAGYLEEVAANEGAYIAAGALATIGTLLFIAGMLGVLRLLRRPGIGLGQIAAALLTIGLIGLVPTLAFNGLDVVLTDAENRDAAVAIFDSVEDNGAVAAYWLGFFLLGIVLGSLLLAIALFRSRVVPIWSPLLLIASLVLGFVGTSAVLSGLSFLLIAGALLPLAMRIRALNDEEWRRWEPLASGGPQPS